MYRKRRRNRMARHAQQIFDHAPFVLCVDGRRASTRSGGDAREAMTVGCKPTSYVKNQTNNFERSKQKFG